MSAKRKGKRRGKAPSKRAMRRRYAPPPRWVLLSMSRAWAVAAAVNAWTGRIARHFAEMHGLPRDTPAPRLSFASEAVLSHARRGIVYGGIT